VNLYIWKECTAGGAVINACSEVAIQDAAGVDVRQDAVRDERTRTEDRKLLIQIMLLFEKKGNQLIIIIRVFGIGYKKSYSLGQLDAERSHMKKLRRMREKAPGLRGQGLSLLPQRLKLIFTLFPCIQIVYSKLYVMYTCYS